MSTHEARGGRHEERADRRPQRTRRALRDALIALVLEKGYDAVTIREIVERADVGRATFYTHFTDKEALLLSVFEEIHLGAARPRDLRRRSLFTMTADLFRQAQREPRVYRAMLGQFGSGPLNDRIERAMLEQVRGELADLAPDAKEGSVDFAARVMVSAFMGLLRWSLFAGHGASPDELAERFTALLLPGVAQTLRVAPERLLADATVPV